MAACELGITRRDCKSKLRIARQRAKQRLRRLPDLLMMIGARNGRSQNILDTVAISQRLAAQGNSCTAVSSQLMRLICGLHAERGRPDLFGNECEGM